MWCLLWLQMFVVQLCVLMLHVTCGHQLPRLDAAAFCHKMGTSGYPAPRLHACQTLKCGMARVVSHGAQSGGKQQSGQHKTDKIPSRLPRSTQHRGHTAFTSIQRYQCSSASTPIRCNQRVSLQPPTVDILQQLLPSTNHPHACYCNHGLLTPTQE